MVDLFSIDWNADRPGVSTSLIHIRPNIGAGHWVHMFARISHYYPYYPGPLGLPGHPWTVPHPGSLRRLDRRDADALRCAAMRSRIAQEWRQRGIRGGPAHRAAGHHEPDETAQDRGAAVKRDFGCRISVKNAARAASPPMPTSDIRNPTSLFPAILKLSCLCVVGGRVVLTRCLSASPACSP